jgi:hypothetical protein
MKNQHRNKLEITVIQVKPSCKKGDKVEHYKSEKFVIRPDYIKLYQDDVTVDVYKRIKNSCYWRCVGLKGYELAIIARLSI